MESKDRIQEKATEMFMRCGIRSISMDDIAGALGISKKTIYSCFADKDELVESVIDKFLRESEAQISEICSRAENAVEEIFLSIGMIEGQFRNLNPVVLHDLMKFHHKAYGLIKDHKYRFLQHMMKENMERGKREGLYRQDLNVDIMSRFRIESMMVLFDVELFPPRQFNLADVSQEAQENFLYGLSTIKGHELISEYKKTRAIKHT